MISSAEVHRCKNLEYAIGAAFLEFPSKDERSALSQPSKIVGKAKADLGLVKKTPSPMSVMIIRNGAVKSIWVDSGCSFQHQMRQFLYAIVASFPESQTAKRKSIFDWFVTHSLPITHTVMAHDHLTIALDGKIPTVFTVATGYATTGIIKRSTEREYQDGTRLENIPAFKF